MLEGLSSSIEGEALLHPKRLYSRVEVLARPSPVPSKPGVYAWYFRDTPPGVPLLGCHRMGDLTLLYIGISPSKPPANGKAPSTQSLYNRVRYHFSGNAAGSTLRLTLGCLLGKKLNIHLTRVGSGGRYTFTNPGEIKLDDWMEQNAFVCWMEHDQPWSIEHDLLKIISAPLNLDGNSHHPFSEKLRSCRKLARARADAHECLADSGGPRRLASTYGKKESGSDGSMTQSGL
jgi:hypothetical protein